MIPVRTGLPFGGLVASDSLTNLALRTSVIVSIGAVNTLVGLGGEPEPRWIIPTQFHHPDSPYKIYTYLGINEMLKSDETRKFAVDCISTLLEQLFLRFLLANPESVKITILESMTCPFKFKQALAEVLFRRFKARSVIFDFYENCLEISSGRF